MFMKRCLSATLVVFTLVLLAAPAQGATEHINTGQLLDKISASKGKVVLINFFAAFCPPCRKEIPGLIKIRHDYPESDLTILGVAVDEDLAEMEAFITKSKFNYPTFYGGEEVAYSFQVEAIPFNVVYDRSGKIVFSQAGYIPENHLRAMLNTLLEQQ